jgi:hypothetical protein
MPWAGLAVLQVLMALLVCSSRLPGLPAPPQPFTPHGQFPGEHPGLPRPLPGCAPGSSATLGSGPGVVPGGEGN